MLKYVVYGMIDAGIALMIYSIYRYVRFARQLRSRGNWNADRTILDLPIVLLVLFAAGYVAIGVFGRPDWIVAAILFGGSVFVLLMLVAVRRIAERIQHNEQLEAALVTAQEASAAKTFFLSNMSHDIRTPLNAIIGYTTLARRDGVTPDQTRDYLSKIDSSGRQLQAIVDDVLEMSRLESGKIEVVNAPTDLEHVVTEARGMMDVQMSAKGVAFETSCEIEHRRVLCDRNRLNRALINLLSNACKFTPAGGQVRLSLRETGFDGERAAYELRVRDTGIGMSPDFVERVFVPFEREKTSSVSRIQGTGLGMTITKSIVDMMGGGISVESAPGRGTEFTVRLAFPIAEEPERDGACPPPEAMRFDGKRILLVEDNAVNREIAVMLLEQAGFAVDCAENGREGVDAVQAAPAGTYDLVLMDIQMPVMDGYEATRAIRALPGAAKVPIVAMSANAFAEDVRAAREAGMDGHIAKPIDTTEMMRTLCGILHNKP